MVLIALPLMSAVETVSLTIATREGLVGLRFYRKISIELYESFRAYVVFTLGWFTF
jgi:hypothetical protein